MENLRRIALLALLFQIAFCLEVQNPDEPSQTYFVHVVEVGSSLTMKCKELLDASQGDSWLLNVLKWHKTQDGGDDIMANDPELGYEISSLAQPSATFSDRVELASQNGADFLSIDLTLPNVEEEDSGWYSCYSRNSNHEVKYISYDVQVYVAPTSVILTGKPNPEYNGTSVSGALLFKSTSAEGMLECTAVEGNPAPTLSMHIEGETNSLTGFGTPVITRSLVGDIEGLQRIMYNTTVTLNNVEIKADQNGRHVFCVASDPRSTASNPQTPVSTSRALNVLYPPRILECQENWMANVGDKNVKFGCSFEANPVPNVMWVSRPSLDIYPDGKIVDSSYSAQVMATTMKTSANISIFQTDLTLVSVTDEYYHRYDLILTNDLGTAERDFLLSPGETNPNDVRPVTDNGASSYFTTSSLLLCILATFTTYLLRQ